MRSPRQAAGRAGRHDARNSAPWRFLGGNATWSFHGPALPRETPNDSISLDVEAEHRMAVIALRVHQHLLAQPPPDLPKDAAEHIKSLLALQLPQVDVEVDFTVDMDGTHREEQGTAVQRPSARSSASCLVSGRLQRGLPNRCSRTHASALTWPMKTPPTSKHVLRISRVKSRLPRRVNVRLVSQRRSRRK